MIHCPAARALDLYDLVVGLAQQTTARTAANRLHQGCTLEKPRRVDAVAGWPGCGRTRSCGRCPAARGAATPRPPPASQADEENYEESYPGRSRAAGTRRLRGAGTA